MSKQQLYINDIAVDMPAEEIKIKAESNIFNDAGKAKTAHSYNIALPRTMTNDSLFALAYMPNSNTGGKSTHRYMKASLHIDGLPLFVNGYAILTSVNDKGYNLTLLWGLLDIFEIVKDENLNLCDLPVSKHVVGDLGSWWQFSSGMNANYVSGMNNAVYATLDSDSKSLADRLPWYMPVVSANSILSTINAVYNLPLSFSALAQSRIDSLYHPLTSLNCLAKDEVCVINLRTEWAKSGGNWYCGLMHVDASSLIDFYGLTPLLYDNPPSAYHSASNKWQANNVIEGVTGISPIANCKIAIEKVRVFGTNPPNCAFSVEVNGETASSANVGGIPTIDHTFTDEFSVDKGGVICTFTCNVSASEQLSSNINVQLYVKSIDLTDGCFGNNGDWWSYVRNYPKMSVTSYLNELMAHIGGCFVGCATDTQNLTIKTFDEILGSTSRSYDMDGLKTITMSLSDLAQRNVYKHKENDDNGVKYLGDGVIGTKDSTLKLERTAFDSKFKVPMNTMVRLWKVEKNDNNSNYKAQWVGGDDYICGWDSNSLIVRNTGQDFASIISSCYSNYGAIVNRPKEIEVTLRLSVLELLNLDMGRPLHINNLASDYLIESIESDKDGFYKFKLVQI